MTNLHNETYNGKEIQVYVAEPTQILTQSERLHNKIQRKLARGEELKGPFASAAGVAVKSDYDKQIEQLQARLAQLEGKA